MKIRLLMITLLLFGCTLPVVAALSPDVAAVRTQWAKVKYQLPEQEREAAFERLAARAAQISAANPGQAEPLVWEAIVLASKAGEQGGLGALSLVEQAKALLEQAQEIDPAALDGSIYTSLGSLYYQVPGWPLGFGDDAKARQYLEKALTLNPDGIDPNYFYGDFLMDQGDYAGAIKAFDKALAAPPRPGRELADTGRRKEIATALDEAKQKLK